MSLSIQTITPDLLPGASAFNDFLLHQQTHWAQSLSSLETQANWSTEHRESSQHLSIIRHIQHGSFLEKGGINYSFICGDTLPKSALGKQQLNTIVGKPFVAIGISMILHPHNPYVPTVHANLRYFQTLHHTPTWWFASVMDLTPTYGFNTDCHHWHHTCQQACQAAQSPDYTTYKTACDHYYYLPHRNEYRGIGGLWIEQHNQKPFLDCKRLIQSVGQHVIPAYMPIAKRRLHTQFSQKERQFQSIRRARYVEFNLLHDRGTRFGLSMGSRTESILISMPPIAHWPYNWKATPNSPEEKLTQYFLKPKNWANYTTTTAESI